MRIISALPFVSITACLGSCRASFFRLPGQATAALLSSHHRREAPPPTTRVQGPPAATAQIYAHTILVQGELTGLLTLKSPVEIRINVDAHQFLDSKLKTHLRQPTNAQIARFRETMLEQNPGLTREQVFAIQPEDLVKGVILESLYEDIRETILAMNVRSISLEVAFQA